MNHTTLIPHKTRFALLLIPLLALPGCWLTEKFGSSSSQASSSQGLQVAAGDTVLVSMNDKPVITVSTLDRDFEQMMEENPQLKAFVSMMPDAKYNFLMGLLGQEIVDRYVEEQGIDQKSEYQKEWASMQRGLKRMLNQKYFSQEHPVQVSDAEVKKFYDDNKEAMPELLVSRGGVKAVGLSFAKEADAKAFADKAKVKGLMAAATEAGMKDKVHDFKLVNNQSIGVDSAVRAKIVSIQKFPAFEVVKGEDGAYWVVNATGSEEPKYRPFEQVAPGIKQLVEKEKRMESFDAEIGKLKEKYNVKINDDYFKAQQQAEPAQKEQEEASAAVAGTPKPSRAA